MNLIIDMPWERDLSVNHCRMGPQGNWHVKPRVEAWMERLAWEVKALLLKLEIRGETLVLPVAVSMAFRYPDRRKRDAHNYYKIVADAVAVGLGIDDQHIDITTGAEAWGYFHKLGPGFTIEISDEQEGGGDGD